MLALGSLLSKTCFKSNLDWLCVYRNECKSTQTRTKYIPVYIPQHFSHYTETFSHGYMICLSKTIFVFYYYSKMFVYRKNNNPECPYSRMQYKTSLSFVVIYQGQVTFKWPSALSKIRLKLIEYTHNIQRVASCAKYSFVNQLHIIKRNTATQNKDKPCQTLLSFLMLYCVLLFSSFILPPAQQCTFLATKKYL